MAVGKARICTGIMVVVALWAAGEPQLLLKEGQSFSAPFREGERLVYEVDWKPLFLVPSFKAGELSFNVKTSRYEEKETFTITAWAVSNGALPKIAGIDVKNYFESIIDRQSFRSYRLLKQTREGDRKRDVEVLLDYRKRQISVREVDVGAQPPRTLREEVIPEIPGPLSDVLSVFYVARLRNMKVGDRYLVYLVNDNEPRKVPVRVLGREKITIALGRFDTLKLSTEGGLFRGGGDFRIWYSQDSLRVPIKFEAGARFGKVYGHLIRLQTPGLTRSLIKTR